MSTPSIVGSVKEVEQVSNGDPVIYTVPSGSDQTVVVHVYMTVAPTGAVGVGVPYLTYTDEFGQWEYPLENTGTGARMGISVPLRVKAGTTISLTANPSGQVVWSMYSSVELLSAT